MKKSDFITFRTNTETKEKILEIANEKRWTISQTCEILIQDQLKDKYNILYESILDIIGFELSAGHISEEAADKLNESIQKAYTAIEKE